MFWGRIRQGLWLLCCFLCLVILIGQTSPASASIPSAVPSATPKNSLEMQVSEAKEAEPTLTFSLSDARPHLLISALSGNMGTVEAADSNTSQLTTKFQLSPTSELRVSFLYNQDQAPGQSPINPAGHLLFRYSMDYCIMPRLKVGISGYLYKPTPGSYGWRGNSQMADPLYGFGPGVQYDLGRWSFLLRTQLEPGTKDRGDALHNWFRVWYAF
jgi:hypothetical protein